MREGETDDSDSFFSGDPPEKLSIPYQNFQNLWNSICGEFFGRVTRLSKARRDKIRVRLGEWGWPGAGLSKAEEIFTKMTQSDFLKGNNNQNWRATFDWLINSPNNWIKVTEGNYDNRDNKTGNKGPYKFCNDEWR